MKIKLFIVLAVVASVVTLSTMSFKSGAYVPRQSSKIDEVIKYQIPGGKIAAGLSEYFSALRVNVQTGTVSEAEYMAAINASLTLDASTKRVVNSVWNELGPDNVGGRTRAFLQDRDTPATMYVGAVSGGLFKSTTRGSSWVPVNDYQENLNVSCIAQNKDGIIAYGTGEGSFVSISGTSTGTPGFSGAGIFVSTNRGRSFTRINSTNSFGNINSMAAENNGSKIYAATNFGIKISENGTTWTNSRNGNTLEIKVAKNDVVYAQAGTAIIRSKDNGTSWQIITPANSDISRASIAISPEAIT